MCLLCLYDVSVLISHQPSPHSLHLTHIDLFGVAQTFQASSVLGVCTYASFDMKCFSPVTGVYISRVQWGRKDEQEGIKQME